MSDQHHVFQINKGIIDVSYLNRARLFKRSTKDETTNTTKSVDTDGDNHLEKREGFDLPSRQKNVLIKTD